MSKDGISRRTAIVLTGAAAATVVMPAGNTQAAVSEATGLTPVRIGPISIVMDAVTTYYDVTQEEISSPDRSRRIVRPRQTAMYLAFMLSGHSLPEVGMRIGGRDCTQAIYACRKIESLRQSDAGTATDVNRLIVLCIRAMRDNAIPLDRASYVQARWFLKVKPPYVSSFRAERYGREFLVREMPWMAWLQTV